VHQSIPEADCTKNHMVPVFFASRVASAAPFVGTYSRGGSHGGRLGLGDRAAAWRSSRRLSHLHPIGGAGSVVDYLILLNSMVDICLLEQVAEHSNCRAGLRRLTLKRLAEAEFAVLSLRRSIELRTSASRAQSHLDWRTVQYDSRCAP